MMEIFALWTPWAVLSVLLAGAVLGAVEAYIRPHALIFPTVFLTLMIFFFWYFPVTVTRLADPKLYTVGLWTIGSALQAVLFTAAMASSMAVYRRLRH